MKDTTGDLSDGARRASTIYCTPRTPSARASRTGANEPGRHHKEGRRFSHAVRHG